MSRVPRWCRKRSNSPRDRADSGRGFRRPATAAMQHPYSNTTSHLCTPRVAPPLTSPGGPRPSLSSALRRNAYRRRTTPSPVLKQVASRSAMLLRALGACMHRTIAGEGGRAQETHADAVPAQIRFSGVRRASCFDRVVVRACRCRSALADWLLACEGALCGRPCGPEVEDWPGVQNP